MEEHRIARHAGKLREDRAELREDAAKLREGAAQLRKDSSSNEPTRGLE